MKQLIKFNLTLKKKKVHLRKWILDFLKYSSKIFLGQSMFSLLRIQNMIIANMVSNNLCNKMMPIWIALRIRDLNHHQLDIAVKIYRMIIDW